MSKEEVENTVPESDNRLEAVRELLFGQNVQEYRGEIAEVKSLLKEQRSEIDSQASDLESRILTRIDELEKKLTTHLEDLNKELTQRLDILTSEKVDKKQLASLLTSIAREIES